jgi:hypothetical protein
MNTNSAVFLGRVDTDGTIRLDFPQQQRAWCKHKLAGECVEIEIRLQASKRSDRQNRALWALIGEWAKERGHEPDDLKDVMLGIAFGHLEHVMPITGEIRQVLAKPHSSRLNVHEFCHLIEEVLRVAAEDGVFLLAPDEYRKAKEAAERKAAKEAA